MWTFFKKFTSALTVILLDLNSAVAQVSASPSGPAAVYFNPAGITELAKTQLMVGSAMVDQKTHFQSSTTSESAQTNNLIQLIPHLYLTHRFEPINNKNIAFGLGIYRPVGVDFEWPDSWQGRFGVIEKKTTFTIISPIVAFEASDKLSLAAGLQIADIRAHVRQSLQIPGIVPESVLVAENGRAQTWGWRAGLQYKFSDTISTRLQYASALRTPITGHGRFVGPASAFFADTKLESAVNVPDVALAGISIRLTPQWKISTDVVWQNGSMAKASPLTFETTANSPLPQSMLNLPGPRNWHDTFSMGLGLEYKLSPQITLRGGYFRHETPVPDETLTPGFFDARAQTFSIGSGYRWNRFTFDIAYTRSISQSRWR